jgi:hypothetical protein
MSSSVDASSSIVRSPPSKKKRLELLLDQPSKSLVEKYSLNIAISIVALWKKSTPGPIAPFVFTVEAQDNPFFGGEGFAC